MNLRTTFESFSRYSVEAIEEITEGSKFKDTITPWNHLNKPISVGQCLQLYKLLGASSPQDFAMRYLDSGEELERLLIERPKSEHSILKKLHGRTEEQLLIVAHKFLKKLDPTRYTLDDVVLYLWIRLFYQTHVGAHRELLAKQALQELYPHVRFQESSAELDANYAIDLECYQGEQLICGIQVKPESYYFGRSPNTQGAKFQNREKHQKYSDTFQVPVCEVIATQQGEVLKIYTTAEPRTFHQLDYVHPQLTTFNPFDPRKKEA